MPVTTSTTAAPMSMPVLEYCTFVPGSKRSGEAAATAAFCLRGAPPDQPPPLMSGLLADVLRLDERPDAIALAAVHPERRKLGKILGDGVVKADLSIFHELRDRHAAEALRLRALHVDVVCGDLALRGDICVAEARRFGHAVAVEHAHHARELPFFDIRRKRIGHICRPRVLDSVAGLRAAAGHRHRGDESNHEFFHLFPCV